MKTNSARSSWGSKKISIAIRIASVPPPSSVTRPSPWSAGVGVPIRPEIRIRTIETTGQTRIRFGDPAVPGRGARAGT